MILEKGKLKKKRKEIKIMAPSQVKLDQVFPFFFFFTKDPPHEIQTRLQHKLSMKHLTRSNLSLKSSFQSNPI